jgi:hypothetical protein
VCAIPTFYRIVKSDPPTIESFYSRAELGFDPPPPDDLEGQELHRGVSVEDSLEGAKATARRYRRMGSFAAVLIVSANGPIQYRKTRRSGHYTLWGDPQHMLDRVTQVVRL